MARTRRGLGALFLLTVFVGGGFGLPDVDALLYHSITRASRPDVAHVDLPGGCGAHSEKCALTTTASAPQLAGLGLPTVEVTQAPSQQPGFASVPSLRSADRSFLYPSRAPPAPAC
jgi:hypothetical protein